MTERNKRRRARVLSGVLGAGSLAALTLVLSPAWALAQESADDLLHRVCSACHEADANGEMSRISGQRKTPEGWLMTIVRMRLFHGLEVTPGEQRKLVALLSQSHGLAPSETKGFRYILERSPSTVETIDPAYKEMCARCHSGARVALQRRTPEEWSLHVDFHVGQWPTIEYQALGRDRQWYKIAKTETAPKLAEMYPFKSEAWDAWQKAEKPEPRGEWTFLTRLPGLGESYGTMMVDGDAQPYDVSGRVVAPDGTEMPVSGKVTVYTGYEWRGTIKIGDTGYAQVLMLDADGQSLTGRQFLTADDALGGAFKAAKTGGNPQVLGVVPSAVPAGSEATVQIVGTDLVGGAITGPVTPGEAADTDYGLAVPLTADADGNGTVSVTGDGWETAFGVYSKPDAVKVEPAYAIARVGGNDGPVPRVKALFTAIGYWAGADGKPGTDDDVRIGEVPAIWSVKPFDDTAVELDDVKYAGRMDAETGIFTPGPAGPNPERPFSTNNAGNLKVVAESAGVTGEGQLIVTVQRWNDPPIH